MPTTAAKALLAGLLILLAGIACLIARPAPSATPVLPPLAPVLAAAGLQVVDASSPADSGGPYRQWTVRRRDGWQALLYLQATREPQRVIGWTGELGYQGEGFQTSELAEHGLRLRDGTSGTVTSAYLTAPGQFLAMAATDLGPDGFQTGGAAAAPRLLGDEALGRQSVWYLVRVVVPSQPLGEPTETQADQLLAALLPVLTQERARTG